MPLITLEVTDEQAKSLAEVFRLGLACHGYVGQLKTVHTQRMRQAIAEHCANAEGELIQALTRDEWREMSDLLAKVTAHLRPEPTTNEENK